MEPTDNYLSGHSSRSGDNYGYPAWIFFLPESQSPPLPSLDGFAGPENFCDGQLISPPCIIPAAAVGEETNYAAAPPSPLVATPGTDAGQWSEEEIQQMMLSLQEEPNLLDPTIMALHGLSNTPINNGGPAARSHSNAVPPLPVQQQQGTNTAADELPHTQQQLPLPTDNLEAQTVGGGWSCPDLSLLDQIQQIHQMMPTIISPSQPTTPTPVINPRHPNEANHTASAPMGSEAPQDQEAYIPSRARASMQPRANNRGGLPNRVQITITFFTFDEPDPWWDLIIRLSDSSSTTESTHDGGLKFSDNKENGGKIVRWTENPYKNHAGILLLTDTCNTGRSFLSMAVKHDYREPAVAALVCANPWQRVRNILRSLGFRKEFATNFVTYALGFVDGCNLRLRSPRSSNKGKRIVEQGGASSGQRKRKPAPTRSEVWKHFERVEGSMPTKAKCNYCPSVLKADPVIHGTSSLANHYRKQHPEEFAKLPL